MKTLLFCLVVSVFGLGFSVVQLQDAPTGNVIATAALSIQAAITNDGALYSSANKELSAGFDTWFWLAAVLVYVGLVAVVVRTIWYCNGQ